jgi:hypothetical protein
MLNAILGIFIWSLLAPIVARRLPYLGGWVLAVVPATLTFWFTGNHAARQPDHAGAGHPDARCGP